MNHPIVAKTRIRIGFPKNLRIKKMKSSMFHNFPEMKTCKIFSSIRPAFLPPCGICSELPSNISTVVFNHESLKVTYLEFIAKTFSASIFREVHLCIYSLHYLEELADSFFFLQDPGPVFEEPDFGYYVTCNIYVTLTSEAIKPLFNIYWP